jgi:PAS domain S-box-containing protein
MKRVLITDDHEESLYLLQTLLEGNGYRVETARHGAEALVKARMSPPDIVVSDILMPVMDGFTLCRHWQADPRLSCIPFIFYTATYTDPQDERLAMDLGAAAFIPKPSEPAVILSKIRENLALAKDPYRKSIRSPDSSSEALLIQYNEALVHKLEDKMIQLERANRALEEEIEGRRRVEAELRESEKRYRLISENAGDVIWTLDIDAGRFTYVSPSVYLLRGYTPAEVMSRPLQEALMPEAYREIMQNIPKRVAAFAAGNESVRTMTHRVDQPHRDGHLVATEVVTTLLTDETGRVHEILGVTRDVTRRARAEEERDLLFNYSLDMLCIAGFDGYFKQLNPAWERTLGWELPELMTHPFQHFVHAEDREATDQAMKSLSNGSSINNFENRYRCRNQEYRWISWNALPVPERREIFAVAHDVTDYKRMEAAIQQSLEEKEILLKELHHRVKNNLQVICSLLNLQARKIDDPKQREPLEESHGRVRAISFVHEMLYQSGEYGVIRFSGYIRRLVTHLSRTYLHRSHSVRIMVDAVDAALPMNQAVPCGLIIHELVSNALKYAFPEGRNGRILIRLTCHDENRLQLTVSDDGTGIPAEINFPGTTSLGLQLVASLSEQLGGEVGLDRQDGTTFTLAFPVNPP